MDESSTQKSLVARLRDVTLREPLIPLAMVGGLLFAIYGHTRPVPRETIDVAPQTVRALVDFEASLRGSKLTNEQRTQVIESFIDDEVLMREALKQGLERSDMRA